MHIPAAIAQGATKLRETFLNAHPFKYVVIDNFFEDAFAEELLQEFPSFDNRLAKSESGEVGGKAVNTKISAISPAYRTLYSEISSKPFLNLISQLSGIEDLILDPALFGGGTHENLHGQELDPHVDFNYDESEQMHRRLNLIVYLNKGWREEWGGGLEIHSNPRRPEENQVQAVNPLFNRAVMFETNEYSWHGFSKIHLPEEQRQLSRKSISIYLYTKDRPAEEIAPRHATFYVQRPLSERFAAGYRLNGEDVHELRRLLVRRDRWIELYQQDELDANRIRARLHALLAEQQRLVRVPLTGYIRQDGPASGFHGDLWAGPTLKLRVSPLEPVIQLELKGFRPEGSQPGSVSIWINGVDAGQCIAQSGMFSVSAALPRRQAEPFDLEVRFDGPGAARPAGGDPRDLAYMLLELRAIHPRTWLR